MRKQSDDADMLTAEELRKEVSYDPSTGVFTKLTRRRKGEKHDAGDTLGCAHIAGYVKVSIRGHHFLAHRLAWCLSYGYWPPHEIDHRNGDRRDNRIENLREATRLENAKNMKRPAHNTSGFKGASKHASGRWQASISANGVQKGLGLFDSAEAAHAAYVLASARLHGQFANKGTN